VASTGALRVLLSATSLPELFVDELIEGASPVWLMGEPDEAIAGDLVLTHPPLAANEVRAAVKPTVDPSVWRLTVAAPDRIGLLGAAAGALANQQLSIRTVSACAWPAHGFALLRLSVLAPDGLVMTDGDWDRLGAELRTAITAPGPAPVGRFVPLAPVRVTTTAGEAGRVVVRVQAPDRIGLLWAVAQWLADHGSNIEVARVGSTAELADDTFVVDGDVDGPELATYLSGVENGGALGRPSPLALAGAAAGGARQLVGAGLDLAGRMAGTATGFVAGAARRLPTTGDPRRWVRSSPVGDDALGGEEGDPQ
jgi:predicted amino acid-binding ACT domain protein